MDKKQELPYLDGFGKNMRNARKALGLTQKELAEIINKSERYVSNIECGRVIPGTATLCDIVRECKMPMECYFNSHLGQSALMIKLSGNSHLKTDFPLAYPYNVKVPDPYCYRCFFKQKPETCNFLCVEAIDEIVSHSNCGKLACFIVEPISGNGGNVVPPRGYYSRIKKWCDERKIPLIFDEIQTGFGRTGYMFAYQHYNIEPDIITIAKGFTGVGLPAAAILVGKDIKTFNSHDHTFTYGNNLLAFVAACKTIEIVQRDGFLENVSIVGSYIMKKLNKMKESVRFIGDVRGLGLMIGIEIVDNGNNPSPNLTLSIIEEAVKHGIIIRGSHYGYGNIIKIRPPLVMTLAEAEELCIKLNRLFDEFTV